MPSADAGTTPSTRRHWRKPTKVQLCLDLLSRPEGTTIEELHEATGWKRQSVMAFLAGIVRKRLGLPLVSHTDYTGPRRYRIIAPER
jgi:uncharacterized protein DUF3489